MASSVEKALADAIGAAQQRIRNSNIEEWKSLLQNSLNEVRRYRWLLLQYERDVKNAQNGITGKRNLQQARLKVEEETDLWIFDNFENSLIANTIKEMQKHLFDNLLTLYAQINTIREILTGEEIKYQVAVKYRGTIVEGSFTLEQLVPYLKRDLTSAADYTIKFAKKTELLNGKEGIEKLIFKPLENQRLFNAINDIFKTRYQEGTKQKAFFQTSTGDFITLGNEGNLYEVYRYLLNKGENNPSPKQIIDAFAEVQSGGGQEGAFYKGGDVNTEQVKAFFGHSPSFFNDSATVIMIAEKLIIEFDNLKSNKTLAVNHITQYLTNKKTTQNVKNEITKIIQQKLK